MLALAPQVVAVVRLDQRLVGDHAVQHDGETPEVERRMGLEELRWRRRLRYRRLPLKGLRVVVLLWHAEADLLVVTLERCLRPNKRSAQGLGSDRRTEAYHPVQVDEHPLSVHHADHVPRLEVSVDPAIVVEMLKPLGQREEESLGEGQVDALLQQHDHEVPLRSRHHNTKLVVGPRP